MLGMTEWPGSLGDSASGGKGTGGELGGERKGSSYLQLVWKYLKISRASVRRTAYQALLKG